jgi:hypothetical protein
MFDLKDFRENKLKLTIKFTAKATKDIAKAAKEFNKHSIAINTIFTIFVISN